MPATITLVANDIRKWPPINVDTIHAHPHASIAEPMNGNKSCDNCHTDKRIKRQAKCCHISIHTILMQA